MDLAKSTIMKKRKEVKIMKIATSFLAGLLLIGSLGTALAEEVVITAEEFTVIAEPEFPLSNYCHEKFPAMSESSLAGNHPQVNPTGDIIDFYGSCDETATGKDQVQSQRIANQHHWVTSFYVNQ
jgi:hypothetical protein